ncbi:MAG: glycosyltransferase family 2 protein [Fibrobacteraceae bacterium]|nr:glycosyltransferase family 2 protein [Fibrobacteraceae bacterium]
MIRDTFIFVPAYNVEKEILGLLESIPGEVLLRTVNVLIIDDGSSDMTPEYASRFARAEVRAPVRVESFKTNSGYGTVVKYALEKAKASGARFAVCLHGDAQYPAAYISSCLSLLEKENAAIVQGSRLAEAGNARKGKMPLYKIAGGKFLSFIENLSFKYKLTDRHSGFLCYSADFLKQVDLSKLSKSFDIDLELLALADAGGFKLRELPIPTRYAGEKSNLKVIPYGFRVLKIAFLRLVGHYG